MSRLPQFPQSGGSDRAGGAGGHNDCTILPHAVSNTLCNLGSIKSSPLMNGLAD